MEVTIKDYTLRPLDQIAEAAGTSTDRRDTSFKRVKTCFSRGHGTVFEFAYITVYIKGISRACSLQLVRHRHASFVQESQRYTTIKGDDWYVIPPAFEKGYLRTAYELQMGAAKGAYDTALQQGIKPEDARFMLPEATKTNITTCMNVRELFHILNLRTDKAAQWEIRELANEIKYQCKEINEQWAQIIELWEDGHEITA